jgi:hypothetical protein
MAYAINFLMLAGFAYAGIVVIWSLLLPETSSQEAPNLPPNEPRVAADASLTNAGPIASGPAPGHTHWQNIGRPRTKR